MFGKIFKSMYTGSMYGIGASYHAVWSYVLAFAEPTGIERGSAVHVELNPVVMAHCIGEPVETMIKVIEVFCSPDPRSRTKDEEGRKLVRLGEFEFRVVNGAKYRAIRDRLSRTESNRVAQARWRAAQYFKKGGFLSFEAAALKAEEDGNSELAEHLASLAADELTKRKAANG